MHPYTDEQGLQVKIISKYPHSFSLITFIIYSIFKYILPNKKIILHFI